MESYKKCPFKKRPIFYETIIEMDQPQDLSLKRKTSSSKICPIEEKRNFFLNLSTNSYYDQMRQNTNDIINRSESPKSITSESSFQDLSISTTTIINNQEENYENIHLRGLLKSSSSSLNNNNYINNYLPKTQQYCWPTTTPNYQIQLTPQHQQQYSDFSYNLTPPSSPLSSSLSEPEDLSMKNTILSLPKISYQQFHHHHHRHHHNPEQDIQSIAAPKQNRPSKLLSSTKPKELNRFKCEKCFKSYSTNTGLSKHQHFHCPSAECNQIKKDFSCQNCDKVYTTLGALKMHIRTHTLPCKCPICGKAFSRPWLLQGHIRTHTGEKPFTCQHCNRAFADRSNLRAHQQTHVDIKKYICENCQKSFSRMSLLTKHIAGGCSGAFV